MTTLSPNLSRALNRAINVEQERRHYFVQLRCQCRRADGQYDYQPECKRILFEYEEGSDECKAVPCGQCPEFRLGKDK